jgi:AraC-like DNA-binding protein
VVPFRPDLRHDARPSCVNVLTPSAPSPRIVEIVLLQRLFENLAVRVDPFATCGIASGWRLSLPADDQVVFHFVLAGCGALRAADGTLHPLETHTLAVVPPRLVHAVETGRNVARETRPEAGASQDQIAGLYAGPRDDAELLFACGRVQVVYGEELGLFDRLREFLVLDFSESPQMRGIFEALLEEQRSDDPGRAAMMGALMNQCLVMVFRRLTRETEGVLPWLAALEDRRLAAVVDAVLEHPEYPHSVDSLADIANMSRSVFAERFRASFGRTPKRYVREVRLRRAAHLLRHDDLSVEAIARRVGFDSRSQFSRSFSRLFGSTPSAFRERAITA